MVDLVLDAGPFVNETSIQMLPLVSCVLLFFPVRLHFHHPLAVHTGAPTPHPLLLRSVLLPHLLLQQRLLLPLPPACQLLLVSWPVSHCPSPSVTGRLQSLAQVLRSTAMLSDTSGPEHTKCVLLSGGRHAHAKCINVDLRVIPVCVVSERGHVPA